MALNHLHEDFEHALKESDVGALGRDEDLQLDSVNKLLLKGQVLAVGLWHKVG